MNRDLRVAGVLLLATFTLMLSSRANVLSWSGGGGANANWNNSANWGFAGVPANGDTVVFPASQPNLLNTNNLVGLILNQIRFAGAGGGYDIRGNALTITNNISVTNSTGANTIEVTLALATAPSVLVIVSNGVTLTLAGNIGGTPGLTKTGTGTMVYSGPSVNGYLGTTLISGGTLQLNVGGASAFGGSLVIGDGSGTGSPTVQLLQPTEISDTAPITINAGGLLDLNGFSEVISPTLAITAGSITTGAGTLMFSGGTTVTVGSGLSTISGNLNNGGGLCTFAMTGNLIVSAVVSGNATIVKSGLGTLTFSGANTYIGQTVVQQGILVAQNALALGTTGAGTVVSNTATLQLDGGITITGEPLSLNGPGINSVWGSLDVESGINTWAGPITNNVDSRLDAWAAGSELHIKGPIVGAGGLELFNNGSTGGNHFFEATTANTYAGTTTVDANTTLFVNNPVINYQTVPGALVINGTVRLLNSFQLHFNSPVTINDGGLLDLNGWTTFIGALNGTANSAVSLGTVIPNGYLYANFGYVGTSTFNGLISGTGTLDKQGIGNLILNNNNTYIGPTLVTAGTLTVNGSQPQTPISVANGCTLSGAGTVGAVTLTGSKIDTGASQLQINGDVTTLASSTTALINGAVRFANGMRTITVNQGSAPGGYDLTIQGNVSDFGAGLQIQSVGAARGDVNINGTNNFTGPLIIGGPGMIVGANSPLSLGTTNGTTFVTNGANLFVFGTGITNETVTLAVGTTFNGQSSGINPAWTGPVVLLGDAKIYGFNFFGTFDISGPIIGTGNLTVATDGETVKFSGTSANTYSGTTTLEEGDFLGGGTLVLAKNAGLGSAIPGALVVSNECTVQLGNSWQIYSQTKSVLLNTNTLFDTAGFNEFIGPLTMQGAQITTGAGALFLGGDILAPPGPVLSTIGGNLSIFGTNRTINTAGNSYGVYSRNWDLSITASITGSAGLGLIKTGYGSVQLTGANSYTGPTVVQQGFLWLSNSLALGPGGSGSVVVSNFATMVLDGPTSITNKPLTLNGMGWTANWGNLDVESGTHFWAGPVTNNANSVMSSWVGGSQLHINGLITGPGGLELIGAGTHYFEGSSSNNYAGTTTVDYNASPTTLVLNKSIQYGAVPTNMVVSGTLRLASAEQINFHSDVQLNASGLFDFQTFFQSLNTLHGTGNVTFGTGGYLNIGVADGTSEFDGLMSGTGFVGGYTVGKYGAGTFTLTANNTYQNRNDIYGGTLIINGQQPQNPVSVAASTGTLGGSGTVGIVTSSGIISPGNSPGILTSSNVTFNSSGTFKVEIAGPNPGSGYDQLNVTGAVSLANAKLVVKMSVPGATNAQYTILNNDASDSVTGTFLGLIEGATVIADNGAQFKITYKGGAGVNDVILTQTTAPSAPVMSGITRLGGGSMQLNGTGITNLLYSIIATTNLLSNNWVVIGTAASDSLGHIQFVDVNAPNFPMRFYRFTWP